MPRKIQKNHIREERITYEAVVDCYNEQEVAMGWYYYLQNKITFPFRAKIRKNRAILPAKKGEILDVLGQEVEGECTHEMRVKVKYKEMELSLPLEVLLPIDVDKNTDEAVGDWNYWVDIGYSIY